MLPDDSHQASGLFCLFKFPDSPYNGPILELRRPSDNQILNFYTDLKGNWWNEDATDKIILQEWASTETIYISKWYDQSGKNNHATQEIYGSQPILRFRRQPYYINFTNGTYFNIPVGTISKNIIRDATPGNYSETLPYSIIFRHGNFNNVSRSANRILVGSGNKYSILIEDSGFRYTINNDIFFPISVTGTVPNTISLLSDDKSQLTVYINEQLIMKDEPYRNTPLFLQYSSQSEYIGKNLKTYPSDSDTFYDGELYYLFVFEKVLSPVEKQMYENILNTLSIPSYAIQTQLPTNEINIEQTPADPPLKIENVLIETPLYHLAYQNLRGFSDWKATPYRGDNDNGYLTYIGRTMYNVDVTLWIGYRLTGYSSSALSNINIPFIIKNQLNESIDVDTQYINDVTSDYQKIVRMAYIKFTTDLIRDTTKFVIQFTSSPLVELYIFKFVYTLPASAPEIFEMTELNYVAPPPTFLAPEIAPQPSIEYDFELPVSQLPRLPPPPPPPPPRPSQPSTTSQPSTPSQPQRNIQVVTLKNNNNLIIHVCVILILFMIGYNLPFLGTILLLSVGIVNLTAQITIQDIFQNSMEAGIVEIVLAFLFLILGVYRRKNKTT